MGVLPHESPALDHAVDDGAQPGHLERLLEISRGTALHRLDGGGDGGVAGHDHDLGGEVEALGRPHHVGAVHVGQPEVDEQQGDRSGPKAGQTLGPGVDDGDGVTFPREVVAHSGSDIAIVVDDEDGFGIHAKNSILR